MWKGWQTYSFDLEGGRPLVLKDVKANTAYFKQSKFRHENRQNLVKPALFGLDWIDIEREKLKCLTKSVDVGVVDLGAEEAFWGYHGVVLRQEKLQLEETTFVGGVLGTSDLDEEVSTVSLWWLRVDSHNYITMHSLVSYTDWKSSAII